MMSRPKVLMFIDWYLPGFRAGGPIRSCANLVEHLSGDIDFYIVTTDRDYQSEIPYPGIETDRWVEGTMGEKIKYRKPGELTSALILSDFQSFEFSKVYIHGMFSLEYSILPLRALSSVAEEIIVAPRGMLRSSALSLKGIKKKSYLRLAKLTRSFRKVRFHATDRQEERDVHQWFGLNAKVHIAPNLPKAVQAKFELISKTSSTLKLLFAGRIAPEKNLLYALEILKNISSINVQFDVYGAVYDEKYLEECKVAAAACGSNVQVEFHSPVPPNKLSDLITTFHALFLPTRGENFGHIILETLMAGRPVIISDETPWINLETKNIGFDINLNRFEDFERAILKLAAMDQEDFDSLSRSAYKFAVDYSSNAQYLADSKALFLPSDKD